VIAPKQRSRLRLSCDHGEPGEDHSGAEQLAAAQAGLGDGRDGLQIGERRDSGHSPGQIPERDQRNDGSDDEHGPEGRRVADKHPDPYGRRAESHGDGAAHEPVGQPRSSFE
jgi:hypothetical protein